VNVEKFWDEPWLGVKGQSSRAIACSLRNIFRYSVGPHDAGGRALIGLGGTPAYQTQTNSEYPTSITRQSARGSKFRGREGNNPDHRLSAPK
jgi:hypothetical protein